MRYGYRYLVLGLLITGVLLLWGVGRSEGAEGSRRPVVERCWPGDTSGEWEWEIASSHQYGGSLWQASNHSEGMPPFQPEHLSYYFTTTGRFISLNASWIEGPFNVPLQAQCDAGSFTVISKTPVAAPVQVETEVNVAVEVEAPEIDIPEPIIVEREVVTERVVEVEVPVPEEDEDTSIHPLWLLLVPLAAGAGVGATVFFWERRG